MSVCLIEGCWTNVLWFFGVDLLVGGLLIWGFSKFILVYWESTNNFLIWLNPWVCNMAETLKVRWSNWPPKLKVTVTKSRKPKTRNPKSRKIHKSWANSQFSNKKLWIFLNILLNLFIVFILKIFSFWNF